jgi:hypothetical protein
MEHAAIVTIPGSIGTTMSVTGSLADTPSRRLDISRAATIAGADFVHGAGQERSDQRARRRGFLRCVSAPIVTATAASIGFWALSKSID